MTVTACSGSALKRLAVIHALEAVGSRQEHLQKGERVIARRPCMLKFAMLARSSGRAGRELSR
eukprot:6204901-Pleurochrysis_carterae.AAC.6